MSGVRPGEGGPVQGGNYLIARRFGNSCGPGELAFLTAPGSEMQEHEQPPPERTSGEARSPGMLGISLRTRTQAGEGLLPGQVMGN